jgi:hypothetical protein
MRLSRGASDTSTSVPRYRLRAHSRRSSFAVAGALNDNLVSNGLFAQANKDYEWIYFFNLASGHLYEAGETFHKAHERLGGLFRACSSRRLRRCSLARAEPSSPRCRSSGRP